MKYKISLLRGARLGILTGLVVTIADSFFMLSGQKIFPIDYPFSLILFNVFAWTLFGIISSSIMHLLTRYKFVRDKESLFWIITFLIPFAIIYSLFGQIEILDVGYLLYNNKMVLPFILILFILLTFTRKRKVSLSTAGLMLPEIILIVIIFKFFENFALFLYSLPKGIEEILSGISIYLPGKYPDSPILFFFTCIPLLFTYILISKKLSNREQKLFPIFVLFFFLTVSSLAVCYTIGHKKVKNNFFPTVSKQSHKDNMKIPYVFLIVLDTVRADTLSIYGGNPKLGKHLKQFAKDSLVYENCIASSSWTIPSHASLFTGLYPREHGTYKHINGNKHWYAPLQFSTLADIFQKNKYNTFAIVSNFGALARWHNFNKGFDTYEIPRGLGFIGKKRLSPLLNLFCFITNINKNYFSPYRTAQEINYSAQSLIDNYSDSPFFLFLNYMDAHAPYIPPRPFDKFFTTLKFPSLYRLKQSFSFTRNSDNVSKSILIKAQYDGEIAYLDHQLNKLFEKLKKSGLYDKSLIVVTSDHGELFYEHGLWAHQKPMYEGAIKIPLLIKFPFSSKTGRKKKQILLSDLFSLILETCSLSVPKAFSETNAQKNTSFVVSELYADKKIGVHRVIYDGKYKLMKYGKEKPIELYDLEKDPKEMVNLAKELPQITDELLNKLTEWKRNHKPIYQEPQNRPVLPEELKNNMRALGYVE